MDGFIGAAYFGYSLRQTGWPVACLQCFHDGHYVQSSKFEGRNQPQNIIPVRLCFFPKIQTMRRYRVKRAVICFRVGAPESVSPPCPRFLDKNDIPAGGKARK